MDSFSAIVRQCCQRSLKLPFSNPDWMFEPKWDGYRRRNRLRVLCV